MACLTPIGSKLNEKTCCFHRQFKCILICLDLRGYNTSKYDSWKKWLTWLFSDVSPPWLTQSTYAAGLGQDCDEAYKSWLLKVSTAAPVLLLFLSEFMRSKHTCEHCGHVNKQSRAATFPVRTVPQRKVTNIFKYEIAWTGILYNAFLVYPTRCFHPLAQLLKHLIYLQSTAYLESPVKLTITCSDTGWKSEQPEKPCNTQTAQRRSELWGAGANFAHTNGTTTYL